MAIFAAKKSIFSKICKADFDVAFCGKFGFMPIQPASKKMPFAVVFALFVKKSSFPREKMRLFCVKNGEILGLQNSTKGCQVRLKCAAFNLFRVFEK